MSKLDELRLEFNRPSFKRMLKEHYPNKCACCGNEGDVEFHHVVALALGGTNEITNIIPLCSKCHRAAHTGRHIHDITDRSKLKGRPPKATAESGAEAFNLYVSGEIGAKKCKELLGYAYGSHITDRPEYKKYLASKNIVKVRNNIDLIAVNGDGLVSGREVGWVKYTDGRKETLIFRDTGKNDVEYKKKKRFLDDFNRSVFE